MRVEWDENRCALTALCTSLAPEVFLIDTDARLQVSQALDESLRQSLEDAVISCPTQAISLRD
jgi:ferredoxin